MITQAVLCRSHRHFQQVNIEMLKENVTSCSGVHILLLSVSCSSCRACSRLTKHWLRSCIMMCLDWWPPPDIIFSLTWRLMMVQLHPVVSFCRGELSQLGFIQLLLIYTCVCRGPCNPDMVNLQPMHEKACVCQQLVYKNSKCQLIWNKVWLIVNICNKTWTVKCVFTEVKGKCVYCFLHLE